MWTSFPTRCPNRRQHWLPQPARDGRGRGGQVATHVCINGCSASGSRVWGGDGAFVRVEPTPVPIGCACLTLFVLLSTLAFSLAAASNLSSLPLSYPSLARCCRLICTGYAPRSPCMIEVSIAACHNRALSTTVTYSSVGSKAQPMPDCVAFKFDDGQPHWHWQTMAVLGVLP